MSYKQEKFEIVRYTVPSSENGINLHLHT